MEAVALDYNELPRCSVQTVTQLVSQWDYQALLWKTLSHPCKTKIFIYMWTMCTRLDRIETLTTLGVGGHSCKLAAIDGTKIPGPVCSFVLPRGYSCPILCSFDLRLSLG